MEGATENESVGVKSVGGSPTNTRINDITFVASIQQAEDSTDIFEDIPPAGQAQRGQNLILQMPLKATDRTTEEFISINMPLSPCPTPRRVNFSPLPSPSYPKVNGSPDTSYSIAESYIKSSLPKLSLGDRNSSSDIEKAVIVSQGASSTGIRERQLFRSFSLSRHFLPKMKRAFSLPVTPISDSNPESMHGANGMLNYIKGGAQLPIHRSLSVPVICKEGSLRQLDSLGVVLHMIPNTPQAPEVTVTTSNIVTDDADGKDVMEEEAVCRICFIALEEGSADTLKMECSCKGELALAHKECAVKWFSVQGNVTCDVCKQDVRNLPVSLLRKQTGKRRNGPLQADVSRNRFCQDAPVLVIISMLAYFCFLEQLMIVRMGSSALSISLPFSVVFGILASMTSTTMVRKSMYVWAYATAQFLLMVLFAYLFYIVLHFQAVLSVILSSFIGFGVTLFVKSLIQFLRERILLALSNLQHRSWDETEPGRQPGTGDDRPVDPHLPENESQGFPSSNRL